MTSVLPHRGLVLPNRAGVTDGILLRSELVSGGSDALLRYLARNGALVRVLQGAYVDPAALADPLIVERAALRVAPQGSVLVGLTAAWLHARHLERPAEVHLWSPGQCRVAGIRAHDGPPPTDVTEIDGLPVTGALPTLVAVARGPWSRRHVLVVLDAVLHCTGAAVEEVAGRLADAAGGRGITRGAMLLGEAEPLTESPGETRLRLDLVDDGLPRPRAQVVVRTAGGAFLARNDLGYDEADLGLEYEGDVHLERDVAAGDRRRFTLLELRASQRIVLRYGSADLDRRGLAPGEVREVLAARAPHLLRRT